MSKVLVDRELLERCVDRWACCAIVQTPGAEQAWLELRAVVKAAKPAEAEGVDFGFDDRSVKVSQEAYSIFLERERHHLAALSAVTAERDRLLSEAHGQMVEAFAERDEVIAERDQLRAEVAWKNAALAAIRNHPSVTATQADIIDAAMAAKEV